MKMIKFSFAILALLFFSCNEIGIKKDKSINLYIVDHTGKNLLNPPSSLSIDNIDVFHVVDGKPTWLGRGDSKGYLFIGDDSQAKMLRIFPYDGAKKEKQPLTLIKIGDFLTDTIKTEFKFEGSSVWITKVWFNNVLKYDLYAKSGGNTFTIIK